MTFQDIFNKAARHGLFLQSCRQLDTGKFQANWRAHWAGPAGEIMHQIGGAAEEAECGEALRVSLDYALAMTRKSDAPAEPAATETGLFD